jgi:hypothetical protein
LSLHRHRLERVLIAFLIIATLFLLVVYVVAPSIYTNTLLLASSPADRYPLPATLFMVAILAFITVLLVGIIHHWRWLFWLLLVAFGCMLLEIPATILQLIGVIPNLFPTWYSLCRMGVATIAVAIAIWMIHIYRHYGAWAMGRQNQSSLE